ncbi:hypothetical protein [Catenovulum sediminis]|uniref:Uncharacterized protein n=1 Tax=Catenovulum sediminis TaxID=1740262 RepID=A0ABV1RBJ8_9ALTE
MSGVAACSTGLGCVAGVSLIVLGVSNIGEAGTGFAAPDGKGFNLTGAAIERGFDALGTENSADLAAKTNAVINLTADLAGLNVPSLAKNGFKLFVAYFRPNCSSYDRLKNTLLYRTAIIAIFNSAKLL